MPAYYQWDGDDLILELYVQPKAKNDEWVGEYNGRLKVRITAPPVDNKANKYLLKFLAKTFAVSASRVTLLKGENQRNKRMKIIEPMTLPDFITKGGGV
jgi:uncharacterized protein (TIGR00251 family)